MSPRHQNFDSNGPSIRIRGNAHQVYEKYLQLARDATASGDRIMAENMYQHAEHYFRILSVDDGDGQQPRQNRGNGNDSRYADQQNNGDDQSENDDSENGDNGQERDEDERRGNTRQSASDSDDNGGNGRRPARRPRRNGARNAPASGNEETDGEAEAEVIVEKIPVEAASPDAESAEEQPVD